MINKKFAKTLRRIAADPDDFYTGELAKDIVADIAEYGNVNILLIDTDKVDTCIYKQQATVKSVILA